MLAWSTSAELLLTSRPDSVRRRSFGLSASMTVFRNIKCRDMLGGLSWNAKKRLGLAFRMLTNFC